MCSYQTFQEKEERRHESYMEELETKRKLKKRLWTFVGHQCF
jgi:hypothetical protein